MKKNLHIGPKFRSQVQLFTNCFLVTLLVVQEKTPLPHKIDTQPFNKNFFTIFFIKQNMQEPKVILSHTKEIKLF